MTSPVRRRRDRSRRRSDAPETIEAARQCFACTDAAGRGIEPLSRSDIKLIRQAAANGWNTSDEKQTEYLARLVATLNGDDINAAFSAAQCLLFLDGLRTA